MSWHNRRSAPVASQYPIASTSYVQYAPPPPTQPRIPTDPNAFRDYYRRGLQALTFNSKQIINDLTHLAFEHSLKMSNVIAQAIEEHLRMADPAYKLPTFYLLDSIAKNIGPPYVAHFSRFIERSFLSSYMEVDPSTKFKMEELLGTWRTGGSNGTELFAGTRVQKELESRLFGKDGRGGGIGGGGRGINDNRHFLSGIQQLPSAASVAERELVLQDIRRLLSLRQTHAIAHPNDDFNQTQMMALQQLEKVVAGSQLSADQVYAIRQELAALAPESESAPMALPNLFDGLPPDLLNSMLAPATPPQSAAPNFGDLTSLLDPALLSALTVQTAPVAAVAPATSALAAAAFDLETALNGLGPSLLASLTGDLGSRQADAENVYRERLLKTDMRLTNNDITRYRPTASEFLYDTLPLQCKQCGARYLESLLGKKAMDTHLDWHFKHKKRMREATRKQTRSWFANEDDWVLPPLVEITPAKADVEEQEAVHLSTVVAPSDPIKASRPCPICKEGFKSEWNQQDEEWIWLDAVKFDDFIYHATCHSEATRARLISRVKDEGPPTPSRSSSALPDSRETTPVPMTGSPRSAAITAIKAEASDTSRPPSALGKRKADSEASASSHLSHGDSSMALGLKRVKSEPGETESLTA